MYLPRGLAFLIVGYFTGYIWVPRKPSVALSFCRSTRFSGRIAKELKKAEFFSTLPFPSTWCHVGYEGLVPSALTSHLPGTPPSCHTPEAQLRKQGLGLPFTSSPPTGPLCPAQPGNLSPGRKTYSHSSVASSQIVCRCPSDSSPNGLGGLLKNKSQEVTALILLSTLILFPPSRRQETLA